MTCGLIRISLIWLDFLRLINFMMLQTIRQLVSSWGKANGVPYFKLCGPATQYVLNTSVGWEVKGRKKSKRTVRNSDKKAAKTDTLMFCLRVQRCQYCHVSQHWTWIVRDWVANQLYTVITLKNRRCSTEKQCILYTCITQKDDTKRCRNHYAQRGMHITMSIAQFSVIKLAHHNHFIEEQRPSDMADWAKKN